jgi:hypothetical protein
LSNPVYVRFFLFRPEEAGPGGFLSIDNHLDQAVDVDWQASVTSLEGNGILASATFGTGILPSGRWICVLTKLQTGGGGELSLFVDGKPTPELTSGLLTAPTFERVMFAISADGNQAGPINFWIDEVVVSPMPVSCAD